MPAPEVTPFFDEATHTFSHVVADPATARCAIIDPLLDCDDAAGRTGTARCDFPGGDARQLYRSIRRLFALPGGTRLFLCHDDKAPGRDCFCCETTVAEEKRHNPHVREGIDEDRFVAMRRARDERPGLPRLILPSVQTNMRGGRPPEPEDNGTSCLELPLDHL